MSQDDAFRLSISNVLRFENVLRRIVAANWEPGCKLTFDPTHLGISTNTARARLLDALISLLSSKTQLPNFDVERLRTVRPLFYIATDESGNVVVLTRSKKEQPTGLPLAVDVVAGGHAISRPSVVLAQTEEQFASRLRALALLLSFRDLEGYTVRIQGTIPEELSQELLSTYDIALTPDGADTLMF